MEASIPMKSLGKRSRTAPADTRRHQLIDATITTLGRHGISGTTLAKVAREAGLSPGLVSFHFAGKDALLAATLQHLADEHRDLWIGEASRPDTPPAAKLQAIVDAQFHPSVCNRRKLAVWFAFFGEVGQRRTYRRSSQSVDEERQRVTTALCASIAAEGEPGRIAPEAASMTLEGLFDGLWLNILMYPRRFTPEGARDQVMAYLRLCFPDQFPAGRAGRD